MYASVHNNVIVCGSWLSAPCAVCGSLWLTNSPQSGCQDLPNSRPARYFSTWQSCIPEIHILHTSLLKVLPQRSAPTCVPFLSLFPVPHPSRRREGLHSLPTLTVDRALNILQPSPSLTPFSPFPAQSGLHSSHKVLWPVPLTASCLHRWRWEICLEQEKWSKAARTKPSSFTPTVFMC